MRFGDVPRIRQWAVDYPLLSERLFEVLIKVLFAFFAKKMLSDSLLMRHPALGTYPVYSHHVPLLVVEMGVQKFWDDMGFAESSVFVTESTYGHLLVLLETV